MSDKAFIRRCKREVGEFFSKADVENVHNKDYRFKLFTTEQVIILSRYSVIDRLRLAIPLLAVRNPGRKFTHRELGMVVCTSRERVGKSLARLRADGVYGGEITNSGRSE